MIEEQISLPATLPGWIQEKVEHARELLYSHCFYADEHRELVKDNVGHAGAILGDVVDLLNDAARLKKSEAPASQNTSI